MKCLRILDGAIEYPFALQTLAVENPNTSFPVLPSDDVLAEYGVYTVEPSEEPRGHIGVDVVLDTPELVNGIWRERWKKVPVGQAEVAVRIEGLCAEVDDAVARIYTSVGRYSEEYKLRELQAQEFQAGNYGGPVPRQVAAFANRAGVPSKYATDLILSQAQQLRAALDDLGDLRMRKYEIRRAPTPEMAQAAYDEIMAVVTAIGASLE